MEEAEALSDRIAIMKDGRLLICDTAEAIRAAAGTDHFEQAFIRIVKGVAQ
jgi:ABC-type Na+ transport system ATPase subunit NatA